MNELTNLLKEELKLLEGNEGVIEKLGKQVKDLIKSSNDPDTTNELWEILERITLTLHQLTKAEHHLNEAIEIIE